MSGFESWPTPILRRWLLSAAAGPVIFLLEALVTDLNSRGHSSLTVQENGEIFVQTKENETEPAKEAFLDFPEKVYWPQLVKVLESEGYAADARDADILVSW